MYIKMIGMFHQA